MSEAALTGSSDDYQALIADLQPAGHVNINTNSAAFGSFTQYEPDEPPLFVQRASTHTQIIDSRGVTLLRIPARVVDSESESTDSDLPGLQPSGPAVRTEASSALNPAPSSDDEHGSALRDPEALPPNRTPARSQAAPQDTTEAKLPNDPAAVFALPASPAEALTINDAHRRADVPEGADLWSIEQALTRPRQYSSSAACRGTHPSGSSTPQYSYPTATFVPPAHWPVAMPCSQAEYTARFAGKFPVVARVLPCPGVVVAGGAAMWPLVKGAVSDVDLFVYGAADEAACWKTLAELDRRILRAFVEVFSGEAQITQRLTLGVLTYCITRRDDPRCRLPSKEFADLKIQVILRAYPTVSAILHGFDIPAACVAYDGQLAWTTGLGAYAHTYRVNIVNPAYRSLTYERRLCKYFERGFALALPCLDVAAFKVGHAVELSGLRLVPESVCGGLVRGQASLVGRQPLSDYEPETAGRLTMTCGFDIQHEVRAHNVHQIASGTNHFHMAGYAMAEDLRKYLKDPTKLSDYVSLIDWDGAETGPEDLVSKDEFDETVNRFVRGVIDWETGRVNIRTLRDVFCLDTAQLSLLLDSVYCLQKRLRHNRINLTTALEPFVEQLRAKYQQVAPVSWWIVQEPGRQHTASFNPAVMDPALWYGAHYTAKPKPLTPEEMITTLLATIDMRAMSVGPSGQVFSENECLICHEVLTSGSANAVVLDCGHRFHWNGKSDEECGGIYRWIKTGNHSCPMCRASFANRTEGKQPSRPYPYVAPSLPVASLSIDW